MQTFLGAIVCGSVAMAPAFAGQRGHHATPTPAATHPATPAHPANGAPHSAPVLVPAKIEGNPALVARLQPLLPPGMALATAATGFKNEGQFVAALHVARNLNIPFTQLKAEMNGADHHSLGQAIHDLQPTANVKSAVKTAEHEAKADIKATTSAKTDTDKDDR
jgi:hypothetical protein